MLTSPPTSRPQFPPASSQSAVTPDKPQEVVQPSRISSARAGTNLNELNARRERASAEEKKEVFKAPIETSIVKAPSDPAAQQVRILLDQLYAAFSKQSDAGIRETFSNIATRQDLAGAHFRSALRQDFVKQHPKFDMPGLQFGYVHPGTHDVHACVNGEALTLMGDKNLSAEENASNFADLLRDPHVRHALELPPLVPNGAGQPPTAPLKTPAVPAAAKSDEQKLEEVFDDDGSDYGDDGYDEEDFRSQASPNNIAPSAGASSNATPGVPVTDRNDGPPMPPAAVTGPPQVPVSQPGRNRPQRQQSTRDFDGGNTRFQDILPS